MFQSYKTGGILSEMKPKSCLKFKSLADSFKDPSSDKHEFTKFLGPQHGNQARWEKGAGKTCHIAWLAALDFQEKTGHYPRLHNEDDAAEFLNVAASTLAAMPEGDMGPFQDEIDKKTLKRINTLIKDIQRHPFEGIGDPEPLKHNWSGYWSRRIDRTHRLVYKVTDSALLIAQCRYHY